MKTPFLLIFILSFVLTACGAPPSAGTTPPQTESASKSTESPKPVAMERQISKKPTIVETGSVVIVEIPKKTMAEPIKKTVSIIKPTYVEKKSIENTELSLKQRLTNTQFEVTQNGATEIPYKNLYWNNYEAGIYVDIIDGVPIFSSVDKFDSGTGWPSFTRSISNGVVLEKTDNQLDEERTEVIAKASLSHLGHVFTDGPVEKGGKRYCINSASLRFIKVSDLEKEGYVKYLKLFQ